MTPDDRPTIPVPASSLTDAALLADWRARKAAADTDFRLGETLAGAGQERLATLFMGRAAKSYGRAVRARLGGAR
jgi:hypothetical protein